MPSLMRLRIWTYYFRHACENIFSNRLIHGITIGTISVSLLLFSIFMLFYVNVNYWMMEWGQSISMSVYLKEGINKQARGALEASLRNMPGASIKGFISKEKAEEELIEALGDQAGLLDALSENPLPASFEIIFKDVNRHPVDPKKTKALLEKKEGVDEVQYSEQWLERFDGLIYMLKVGGSFLGGLLCIAVLFIITNTIKLMIYSRRDEIQIFKLVGATDWFVKIPFLIEGAIQGVISGLLALLVLFLMYILLSLKSIYVFGLPVMDIVFLPPDHALFLILLGLGLGLVGSFIAIGRFFSP